MARAEFDKGDKLRRWERNLANPTAALKQIGALMKAESQQAFRDQRFGEDAWPERGKINRFGIIADFALAGRKEPRKRRFERRPALIDTGDLRRKIDFRIIGTRAVEVGSNLPYSGKLHRGGTVQSEPINAQVRKKLWAWLQRKGAEFKDRLGFLLNKKFKDQKLEMEIPARPFVGVTRRTVEDIAEAVGVRIFEAR